MYNDSAGLHGCSDNFYYDLSLTFVSDYWRLRSHYISLQEALANEYTASVNRVAWSHDGALFGIPRFIYLSLFMCYLSGCSDI